MKKAFHLFYFAVIIILCTNPLSAQSLTICLQDTNGNFITDVGNILLNETIVNAPFQVIDDCRVYDVSGWEAGDYSVNLNSDESPLPDVSTYDLVLVHKHILQIITLDSPEKIIAADVNNSGGLSTIDKVYIQRMILAIDANWINGMTYTLIPTDYSFPNPTNPWQESSELQLNDTFTLPANEDILIDLIRIKKGDVN